jgi:hypothetical protein
MVGIQGLGGIPEPKPERPAKVRDGKTGPETKGAKMADDVVISSEAQAAARVARALETAGLQEDIRAERVTAAREKIERGDYKRPEVVAEVAKKISKYLP